MIQRLSGHINVQQGLKKEGPQALGKSRSGFSTKIHATCDSHGNPLRFILTGGQRSDFVAALGLLSGYKAETVLADRGYDSDAIIRTVTENGEQVVIPSKRNRKVQGDYDKHLYKERNLVERLFNKLKNFRRVATRYDKLDIAFLGFICLGVITLWLK